jgi:hypothetical protein
MDCKRATLLVAWMRVKVDHLFSFGFININILYLRGWRLICHLFFFLIQKVLPALAVVLRNLSDTTDLKAVLAKKIPDEQERVKNFRKTYGSTKIGEVTVDMVSVVSVCGNYFCADVYVGKLLFRLMFCECSWAAWIEVNKVYWELFWLHICCRKCHYLSVDIYIETSLYVDVFTHMHAEMEGMWK